MEIILRATVIFFFIWLVSRALGKRELAEMTAFELMLLVVVGDFVQQGVTENDFSVTGAMFAVGTLAIWTLMFSYVTFRWRNSEPVITGVPTLVVREGELLSEVLKLERVPPEEVYAAAREQGIDNLAKVRFGIIEADGRFSFIRSEGGGDAPERKESKAGR
jgi:uncharacterized membrane protein YcaP (DUF421 family)